MRLCFRILVSATLVLFLVMVSEYARGDTTSRRLLSVALYPFIPDADQAAFVIKREYERRYPDVNLQLSFNGDYYNDDDGIFSNKANVYELDSVFLADFVSKGRIQPLPPDIAALLPNSVAVAQKAATLKGKTFGEPHWLCSNFLMYRASDTPLAAAKALTDIEKAFDGGGTSARGLLIDLKGHSTLGEMYLNAVLDHYGSGELALQHIDPKNIDPYPLSVMNRVLRLSPRWQGRDLTYHNLTGAYAREFGKGEVRALVGYSESLFYALSEARTCGAEEGCLREQDIGVGAWPMADEGSKPIGWVDMFVIDKSVSGQTTIDASNFIKMMNTSEMYNNLLIPTRGNVPRYLLPAREDIYQNSEILKVAPLYPAFRKYIETATIVTDENLNSRLRQIGQSLDAKLPDH